MRIFEYAIIVHPNKKQKEQGERCRFVVEPKAILAQDEKQAALLAGREIPEDLLAQLEQVEVAVRPF